MRENLTYGLMRRGWMPSPSLYYFSSLGPPLLLLMDQSKTYFSKAVDSSIQKPR
jgi:hypothetical protein